MKNKLVQLAYNFYEGVWPGEATHIVTRGSNSSDYGKVFKATFYKDGDFAVMGPIGVYSISNDLWECVCNRSEFEACSATHIIEDLGIHSGLYKIEGYRVLKLFECTWLYYTNNQPWLEKYSKKIQETKDSVLEASFNLIHFIVQTYNITNYDEFSCIHMRKLAEEIMYFGRK